MRLSLQGNLLAWSACFVLAISFLAPSETSAEPLHSPYAMTPGLHHPAKPLNTCPDPPAPLRNLAIESIFVPGKWNDKVPERQAAYSSATRPLHDYLAKLSAMANAVSQLKGEAKQTGRSCVLQWITAWAQGGAMLGEVNWPEGHYERKWSLIALGEIYLQLYSGDPDPPLPPEPIVGWFRAMVEPLPRQYPDSALQKNNHFYWAGLAGVVVGTVLKERATYDWGVHRIRKGIEDIDPDGYLPLELKRGRLALVYHAFSASALVQAAAFMRDNGDGKPLAKGGGIERLVHRVLLGLSDPSVFESKAGVPQSPLSSGDKNNLGWIELYYRMTSDPLAEPWIRALRPFNTIWFGGNISDLFGVALPAGEVGKSRLFER